ncbi:uncharacterized protein LOC113464837 isoform X2 [Ceratina calcarata]|uniref:Uncharacterized protein LOC113464837 isoform X2 n=1 Tax=Ceratina calcarata TaxID=156304 RepID=A0AAJ7WDZ8_9HYME|nr:uncharacterized protein LOC113464837 isoform X2 [Ceratina calcarata]
MMLGILRNCKTLGWLFPYSQVYPRSLKLFQVISSSAHAITMWKANKSRLCSDKYIIKKRLQKETRKILHVGGSLYSKLQNVSNKILKKNRVVSQGSIIVKK